MTGGAGRCHGDPPHRPDVATGNRLVRTAGSVFKSGGGRDGQHPPVIGAHDLPTALVNHPVMPVAEKGEVGHVTGSVMDPVHKVVASVMLTGRSHPGHVQPPSRTLSALRCGP